MSNFTDDVWCWSENGTSAKETFLSQASISLHQDFAHSTDRHRELQDLTKPSWEMLPAENTVNGQLHPKILKTPMLWHVVAFAKLKFPWNICLAVLKNWIKLPSWQLNAGSSELIGIKNLQTSEGNQIPISFLIIWLHAWANSSVMYKLPHTDRDRMSNLSL